MRNYCMTDFGDRVIWNKLIWKTSIEIVWSKAQSREKERNERDATRNFIIFVRNDRRYWNPKSSVVDGVERDHRSGQRLPQKDIDRRVQVRALSPERFVRPILRDEDNIRYADSVLNLVKISPCLLRLIFNPYSAKPALSHDDCCKLIVSLIVPSIMRICLIL